MTFSKIMTATTKRFASAIATASILTSGVLAINLLAVTTQQMPAVAQIACNAIRYVNFSATAASSGVNVRSGPSLGASIIGRLQPNERRSFDAWTYGAVVNDIWTNQPDARWYKLSGQNAWVASAVVAGNAPGSTPLCSNSGGLHSNPTESNPLRGFRNPLGQPENPFPWTHWDGYGQKYAVDLGNTYIGAPVYAMRSGTVVEAYDGTPDKAPGRPIDDGKQGTTANLLIIKLDDSDGKDDGYRAMYLHLKQGSIPAQFKQKGARVNAGDKIGEVGYNGLANGVHLHVEVNLLNGNGQNKWDRRTIPFQWK